jgi:hypothetical protein
MFLIEKRYCFPSTRHRFMQSILLDRDVSYLFIYIIEKRVPFPSTHVIGLGIRIATPLWGS